MLDKCTIKDKIRNRCFRARGKAIVTSIEKKMAESHLRWFGHVKMIETGSDY